MQVTKLHQGSLTAAGFFVLTMGCAAIAVTAMAQGHAYDCSKAGAGSIEGMICGDSELSALDRTLSDVYAAASRKTANEHALALTVEQRGWIMGRDDCSKSGDQRRCVEEQTIRRIAELQARYRLVPGTPAIRYLCDGNPANEVVVTYFRTDPPTMIAERGDSVTLMYLQPSGSGAKYQGRNDSFWEHHGEALIVWGYDAPEMRCKKTD